MDNQNNNSCWFSYPYPSVLRESHLCREQPYNPPPQSAHSSKKVYLPVLLSSYSEFFYTDSDLVDKYIGSFDKPIQNDRQKLTVIGRAL